MAIFYFDGFVYYQLKSGRYVAEQYMLSLEEYRAQFAGTAACVHKDAARRLSWLQALSATRP